MSKLPFNEMRMIRLAGRAFLFAVTVATPAALQGQTPPERVALGRFRDSLEAVPDTAGLKQLEARLMLAAKRDRSNASRHLSLGYLALRLGEFGDAVAEFKWGTQLEPQWPLAWFGLGTAELLLGQSADTTKLGRQALLSRGAWTRAGTALVRALSIDPSIAGDLERLTKDAVADSAPGRANVVRDALRRSLATRPKAGIVALSLGRVERMLGDTAAALAQFDAAAAAGTVGPARYEEAHTRLIAGDELGIQAYYDAISSDDAATVAAIRRELAWVASEAELQRFDNRTGKDRAQAAWEIWTARDRRDLRHTGERLVEHYRRLARAAELFQQPGDQRALVFIRHGEPDGRATAPIPGVEPNESWWYRRPDGELFVHFVLDRQRGYQEVPSLFDVIKPSLPVGAAGDEQGPSAGDRTEALLRSRAQLSPFYQAAVAGRRDQIDTFRARERAIGIRSREEALTTDRFPLKFTRDIAARLQLVGLTHGGSGPLLHILFAVPEFAVSDSAHGRDVPVRVRLALWDSLGAAARAIDTTVPGLQEPDGEERWIRGGIAVPVPAGTYLARVALEGPGGAGAMATRDSVRIGGPPAGGSLGLSDLLVSARGVGVGLDLGSTHLVANPAPTARRADTLAVAAQILGGSGSGKVRVLVRPRSGSSESKWRSFPGKDDWASVELGSGDSASWVRLDLPLKKLKAGNYELEMVVVDARGQTARSRATVEVGDDRKEGKTR